MDIDIFLTAKSTNRKIQFPSLPDKINISFATKYQSYTILDLREVAFPSGTAPCEVYWNSVFYGPSRKDFSFLIRSWTDPQTMCNTLQEWYMKGEVIKLVVADTPINVDVTISNFEYAPFGGYGDYEYSIRFKEYNGDEVVVTKATVSNTPTTQPSTPSTNKPTYTVKPGDTLWGLAFKFWGSGLSWGKIFNANKSVITSTAKKYGKPGNGHWIYPGTVLKIP